MHGNTSVTGKRIPSSARAEGALVTLVERKSLYTVIQAVLHKTAGEVRNAVNQALTPHKDRVRTITYDNGREFTDHKGMAKDLETRIYFVGEWLKREYQGINPTVFPQTQGFDHRDQTQIQSSQTTFGLFQKILFQEMEIKT
jgi:hypothetical protein